MDFLLLSKILKVIVTFNMKISNDIILLSDCFIKDSCGASGCEINTQFRRPLISFIHIALLTMDVVAKQHYRIKNTLK